MKTKIWVVITLSLLVMTGCSLKEDAADLYKKEEPLHAEMITQDSYQTNQQEVIQVILTQNGKRIKEAEKIQLVIRKQDGTYTEQLEPSTINEEGIYTIPAFFKTEGLYFARLHAENEGSAILPEKQFVVGELTESDWDYLKAHAPKQQPMQNSHH